MPFWCATWVLQSRRHPAGRGRGSSAAPILLAYGPISVFSDIEVDSAPRESGYTNAAQLGVVHGTWTRGERTRIKGGGACRQPSETGFTCVAASWVSPSGQARLSRSAERAVNRPTSCDSRTITPRWYSPARTQSSSIRTGNAERDSRDANLRGDAWLDAESPAPDSAPLAATYV